MLVVDVRDRHRSGGASRSAPACARDDVRARSAGRPAGVLGPAPGARRRRSDGRRPGDRHGDRLGDRIAADTRSTPTPGTSPAIPERSWPAIRAGFGALGFEVVEAPSTIEGVTRLVALAPDGTQVFVVIIPPDALASNPDLAAVADAGAARPGLRRRRRSRRSVTVAVTRLVAPAVARPIPEG